MEMRFHTGALALAVVTLTACTERDGGRDGGIGAAAVVPPNAPMVTVYKNPSCQCCADWADHLREHGFRVTIRESADLTRIRAERGVSAELASCHTAAVDGYVIEGHVPADVIRKLLDERPSVVGLAVPGMPPGVPGMPDAGPDRDPYQVIAFGRDGSELVYATR